MLRNFCSCTNGRIVDEANRMKTYDCIQPVKCLVFIVMQCFYKKYRDQVIEGQCNMSGS